MNTSAYLIDHGWKGEGYTLQPSGRGLKKPLLTSRKKDAFGLGKAKYSPLRSQWWLSSFDKSLKDFDLQDKAVVAESLATQAEAKNRKDATERIPNKYFNRAGLYGRFVSGDGLKGTLRTTGYEGTAAAKEGVDKGLTVDTDTSKPTESQRARCEKEVGRKECLAHVSTSEYELSTLEAQSELSRGKQKRRKTHNGRVGQEPTLPKTLVAKKSKKTKKRQREQTLPDSPEDTINEKRPIVDMIGVSKLPKGERQCCKNRKSQAAITETVYHISNSATVDAKIRSKLKQNKRKRRKELID